MCVESTQQTVCPLQVHKAKLKYSGTIVAVKVQYPDSLNVMLQVKTLTLCRYDTNKDHVHNLLPASVYCLYHCAVCAIVLSVPLCCLCHCAVCTIVLCVPVHCL